MQTVISRLEVEVWKGLKRHLSASILQHGCVIGLTLIQPPLPRTTAKPPSPITTSPPVCPLQGLDTVITKEAILPKDMELLRPLTVIGGQKLQEHLRLVVQVPYQAGLPRQEAASKLRHSASTVHRPYAVTVAI